MTAEDIIKDAAEACRHLLKDKLMMAVCGPSTLLSYSWMMDDLFKVFTWRVCVFCAGTFFFAQPRINQAAVIYLKLLLLLKGSFGAINCQTREKDGETAVKSPEKREVKSKYTEE